MRITNQMMINSSIANIQTNKSQINTMDTQLSTQKKINKPSDDPIIAIRALRLRSSLDQVTQYINKNIPDASSWLSVTHDALDQSYNIVSQLYSYCNQGATDSYSPSERNTIVETLNKLKDSFYTQGDVDYAGRYVFTGYATDKPLTYQSDADAKDVDYTITQNFTRDALSSKTVYTNAYSNDDIMNLSVKKDSQGNTASITKNTDGTISVTDADGNAVTGVTTNTDANGNITGVTGNFFSDGSGNAVTVSFTSDTNYIPGDDEIVINSQVGEVLLGENVYKDVYTSNSFSVQYDKSNFKKGDVNPTMYFDCVDNVTGVTYAKKDEDIEYNINFTQKLKVNTQADEAFNIYFGRNIDDLTSAVQNVLDIESQMSKVESMMKEERYSSDADQKSLSDILEGLTKQQELAKSQMTKAFESGIGQMQGYQEQISNAKADVGNRITRLDLTKSRLTEQKTNFTSLKSENEDIDLEEVVISYTSAQLVYNAALSAASKVVQQTLLDFIG